MKWTVTDVGWNNILRRAIKLTISTWTVQFESDAKLFGVVGTMEMETKMETEIPVCEITYDETNVCLQTAIMLRLVYNRSIFIRNGFFRRSQERMHCYYVVSSLNKYVGQQVMP